MSIFVRACPRCHALVQTADQTGATPCAACLEEPKRISVRRVALRVLEDRADLLERLARSDEALFEGPPEPEP